ncbi:hypothetical protein IT570_09085 [Candidatus Sumerlaeota bacterium]|nr:hypothetical protein [Candidatus Sumerlaeota bacterium]
MVCGTFAHAQFQYVSGSAKKSGVEPGAIYHLDYTLSPERTLTLPAEAPGNPPGEIVADDAAFRAEQKVDWVRSCLIALPSDASSWALKVTDARSGAAVGTADSFITAEKVYSGTFPALKVTINEAACDQSLRELRIEVAVVLTRSGKKNEAALEQFPEAGRIARSIFVNAADIVTVPLATTGGRQLRGLPAALAPYRLTYTAGDEIIQFTLAGIDGATTESLRLDHHGSAIAVGGTLGPNAWAYAPRRNTLTDLSDSIFAGTDSSGAGPQIASRPAFVTLPAGGAEIAIPRAREFDVQADYQQSANLPPGTRFVYWRNITNNSYSRDLILNDVVTQTQMDYQFKLIGYNQTSSANPDHTARMSIAGVSLPEQQWEGRTVYTFGGTMNLAAIPVTKVLMTHNIPSAAYADLQFLDIVTLNYTAYPRINDKGIGTVALPAAGTPRLCTIGGFPVGTTANDVIVLDVTDPLNPVRIESPSLFTDTSGTIAIEFEAPDTAASFFAERITSITSVTPTATEVLPALPAANEILGAVYVAPPGFHATLQPLAALQTTKTVMLDPQAAYNAYNGGQQSPAAIVSALKDILEGAPQRTPYPFLLIAAHGSLDPRNYLNKQTGAQVPPFVEDGVMTGGLTIENPMDYPYATVIGDDEFEDMQLGRIPARTTTELARAVNRNVAYDALAAGFKADLTRPGLFITDDTEPSEFDEFQSDVPALQMRWEATNHPSVRVDIEGADGIDERAAIKSALETSPGSAFVLYTGHGNTTVWASEQAWRTVDLGTLSNLGKWPPLVATFTCLTGRFCIPNATGYTLSEAWLLSTDSGAAANIAPSSVDYYSEQRLFSTNIMNEIGSQTERPQTAGELMLRARTKFLLNYSPFAITAREYLLFGDPATKLALSDPPPPTPTETPTPSPTASPSPIPTQSSTPSLTASPSISPTQSSTPSLTASPTPSLTASPSISPTESLTPSPTASPTLTTTPTPSATPTGSPTPTGASPTPTESPTPTASPTPLPSPAARQGFILSAVIGG